MQKSSKTSSKSKKSYATPKLSTHGDVRKLTANKPPHPGAPSALFDFRGHGGRGK